MSAESQGHFPAPHWTPEQAQPQSATDGAQVRALHTVPAPEAVSPAQQPATAPAPSPTPAADARPGQTRREIRTGEPPRSIQDLLADFEKGGEALVRPESGFRRFIYDLSGGRVNPGPSAAERMRTELTHRIQVPLAPRSHHVMVWSQKGGVGKTTTAVAAGVATSMNRSEKILALDTNSDGGSLAVRVPKRTDLTILDLRDRLNVGFLPANDFDAYVNESADTRLDAIVMPPGKKPDAPLTGQDYVKIANALREWYPYKVIFTDCGTDLSNPVMDGILNVTDQMVVVTTTVEDEATVTAGGLEALVNAGWGHVVENAITVLVEKAPRDPDAAIRKSLDRTAATIKKWFAQMTSQVITVPYDSRIRTGGVFDPRLISEESQIAHLALSASIMVALAEDRMGRNAR